MQEKRFSEFSNYSFEKIFHYHFLAIDTKFSMENYEKENSSAFTIFSLKEKVSFLSLRKFLWKLFGKFLINLRVENCGIFFNSVSVNTIKFNACTIFFEVLGFWWLSVHGLLSLDS